MTQSDATPRSRPSRPACGNGRRLVWTLVVCLFGGILGTPATADELSRAQMQGLDEQVQEIKSDVLSIAAELNTLEERLLYPSNTQVAVFVSVANGQQHRLDAVEIRIDGAPVARHIYSFKELEALQKGGVQRIYTGNIATGQHRIDVSVAGKLSSGRDFSENATFGFSKEVEPKLIEVVLADLNAGGAGIQLGDW